MTCQNVTPVKLAVTGAIDYRPIEVVRPDIESESPVADPQQNATTLVEQAEIDEALYLGELAFGCENCGSPAEYVRFGLAFCTANNCHCEDDYLVGMSFDVAPEVLAEAA